jgi:hypothetical protein
LEAETTFRSLLGRMTLLHDSSDVVQLEESAEGLQTAISEILNRDRSKRRWCTRSKRWWTDELRELRKVLGKLRRKHCWEEARVGKRTQRREIRRAKKKCWNSFQQSAEGNEVWMAANYTAPRLDKSGQALRVGTGNMVEGHKAREEILLAAHFPAARKEPKYDISEGGGSFRKVDSKVVEALLRKAGSSSTPGEDRITVGILKVFWEWTPEYITTLVRGCIRLGHHPQL